MKRRVIRQIIVFLLLGAIVNIAVAWGIAVWSPIRHHSTYMKRPLPSLPDWWANLDPGLVDAAALVQFDMRGPGRIGLAVAKDHTVWILSRNGWPCPSLAHVAAVRVADHSQRGYWGLSVHRRHSMNDSNAFLPLRPLWPGFAINTVFYAAVVGALFLGPGMVRRAARRRRGLCPACAYPVGVSTTCTECGSPLPLKVEDSPRRGQGRVRVDAT